MNEDIMSFDQVIARAFGSIRPEEVRQAVSLENEWKNILCRLNTSNPHEGENLASHTHISDLKNGILLVEADHQGWIQILQFHKKYVLKGLQLKFPSLGIKSIAVKLTGTRGELAAIDNSSPQEIKKRMDSLMEKEENANRNAGISEINQNSIRKAELPKEILEIFDDLKESMLTNSN